MPIFLFCFRCLLCAVIVIIVGCKTPTEITSVQSAEYIEIELPGFIKISKTLLSSDGSMIAICGLLPGNVPVIRVYNNSTKEKLYEHSNSIGSSPTEQPELSFSADGTKLLFKLANDPILIINPRTGVEIQTIEKIYLPILTPNGLEMIGSTAPGSSNGSFKLYSLPDLTVKREFTGNVVGVRGINEAVINTIYEDGADDHPNSRYHGTVLNHITYFDYVTGIRSKGIFSYNSAAVFSPDNSISYYIESVSPAPGIPNGYSFSGFYDSQKDKSYSFASFPCALSNDLTYVISQKDSVNNSPVNSFSLYSIPDNLLLNSLSVLPLPTIYSQFAYNMSSTYLSAIQFNSSTYSVRIWKLK